MKKMKIIVCFLAATFVYSLQAQTGAGSIIVGGSTSFSINHNSMKTKSDDTDTDPTKTNSFSISPQAGYFIIDNLAVGVSLPISLSASKDPNDNKERNSSIAFVPFGRYYIPSPSDLINPFAQIGIGIGSNKRKVMPETGDSSTQTFRVFQWHIGAGGSIFFNERVAGDIMFYYAYESRKAKEDNDANLRTINGNFGISGGISVFF